MDSSHHLSNFRVKLNGRQDEAEVYCYALAQHFRKGEGGDPKNRQYLLFGNTYSADIVKSEDEDIWRIRYVVHLLFFTAKRGTQANTITYADELRLKICGRRETLALQLQTTASFDST